MTKWTSFSYQTCPLAKKQSRCSFIIAWQFLVPEQTHRYVHLYFSRGEENMHEKLHQESSLGNNSICARKTTQKVAFLVESFREFWRSKLISSNKEDARECYTIVFIVQKLALISQLVSKARPIVLPDSIINWLCKRTISSLANLCQLQFDLEFSY